MKINLTPEQLVILAPLWEQKAKAERAWQTAMTLMGVKTLVGGDFEGAQPYLLTAEPEPEPVAVPVTED